MGWSRQEKVRKACCAALRAGAAAAQQGMGSKNTLSISSCVSIAATSPKQAHACADVGGQRWLQTNASVKQDAVEQASSWKAQTFLPAKTLPHVSGHRRWTAPQSVARRRFDHQRRLLGACALPARRCAFDVSRRFLRYRIVSAGRPEISQLSPFSVPRRKQADAKKRTRCDPRPTVAGSWARGQQRYWRYSRMPRGALLLPAWRRVQGRGPAPAGLSFRRALGGGAAPARVAESAGCALRGMPQNRAHRRNLFQSTRRSLSAPTCPRRTLLRCAGQIWRPRRFGTPSIRAPRRPCSVSSLLSL